MNQQEQKLRDEILNDARRKAERALTRAERDAAKARDEAAEEQRAEREQALERARQRADTRSRAILVTVDQEVRRQRLLAREAILERCLDQALETACSLPPDDARRSLAELLDEALAALGPGPATVRARPADAAVLASAIPAASQVTVTADERLGAGLVAESADGRRQFDNTYATRRERLRERLRTLLAEGIDF